MLQAGQTDVVMAVPDVAVLVFSTAAEEERWKKRGEYEVKIFLNI